MPITQRFNKDGHKEDLATDFNVNLNSSVVSDIALVEGAFGLPPGSGTFGRTVVSFSRHINIVTFQPAYGLTDSLSIGAIIPYIWQNIRVNARLDNSTATLGFNPAIPGGVAPIGFAGTPPPTTDDIQNLLLQRGFKRLENWSDQSFGDIEVGGRYQYFKSEDWRLAFTGGVRLPTARVDDPNNLVDNTLGYGGEYALLFRLNQDYVHQKPGINKVLGVPEPGAFYINTTFRYDYFIPDRQPLRVCDVHDPLCPAKDDDVRRKLGDIVEAEVSGNFGVLMDGLYITPLYRFGHKFKDHFSGGKHLNYGALSDETDYDEHIYRIALSYSTLPLFLQQRFPAPLIGSIFYRERFAGNNNQFNSKYVGFVLQAFF